MYPVSPQAYDRALTLFSPDGRLFQVEYAKEAVNNGAPVVGMAFKNGVLLGGYRRINNKLVVPESVKKIFMIEPHISVGTSGWVADARRLIEYAQRNVQNYKMTYNEIPTVEYVCREVSNIFQAYTQYGGTRPFGTALLFAGIDDNEMKLFETDPSGSMIQYNAAAIGAGRDKILEHLNKHYKKDMTLENAIKLTEKVLSISEEDKYNEKNIEISYATIDNPKFVYKS
ncbi:archaeal proteasome endopeptidase complex subunit alpha [Candidatus Micrarchaeota archaeon]|jgi:proteasome alpha subunit|nr:archaeal proteasome endopeptidase complex subunit alpha [Candidatus Micrarchaeota archaeon]